MNKLKYFVLYSFVIVCQGSNESEPMSEWYDYVAPADLAPKFLTKVIANVTGLRLTKNDREGLAHNVASHEIIDSFAEISRVLKNTSAAEELDGLLQPHSNSTDFFDNFFVRKPVLLNTTVAQVYEELVHNSTSDNGERTLFKNSSNTVEYLARVLRNATGFAVEVVDDETFSQLSSEDMMMIRRYVESLNNNKNDASSFYKIDINFFFLTLITFTTLVYF